MIIVSREALKASTAGPVITVKGDEDATTRQSKQSYQEFRTDTHAFAAVLSEQTAVFPEKVLILK